MKKITHPLTIFLIGATGDLAKKKIWIALYRLFEQGLLPGSFHVLAVARKQFSDDEFAEFLLSVIRPLKKDTVWQQFIDSVVYVKGDVSDYATFERLRQTHALIPQCGNHLWYVATLPQLYLSVTRHIKAARFQRTNCGWTKLLLEKPFGTNLYSSRILNQELLQVFEEKQIYRIDHFLAKETVQNLLIFRFGNGIFEHLWNNKFIDHIQVTASEKIGIAGRGVFYDATGTVRDVIQNHVLQMLATTLMEEPQSLAPHHIRKRRMEFLSHLEILSQSSIQSNIFFGQYDEGEMDGSNVSSYLDETGVSKNSKTETAVAGKIFVNSKRWQGVPIYFRAGKRLAQTVTEISVKFKEPLNTMFSGMQYPQAGNVLTFRIQPHESVILRFNAKKPGLLLTMEQATLQFSYKNQFEMGLVEAYEKLLYDAIQGDVTLFPQAEDIEASWRFVQPILDYMHQSETPSSQYPAGSWGPESFNRLMEKDGRSWLQPQVKEFNS